MAIKSTCDPDLALRLELLNLIPRNVSETGWALFKEDLEAICKMVEREYLDVMMESVLDDVFEGLKTISRKFKAAVRKTVAKEFVDLGLRVGEPGGLGTFANMWKSIEQLRSDSIELMQAIRKIERAPAGGMFTTEIKRYRAYKIENGIVTELWPSALAFIISNRVDITRLKICPSCEGIFWQAHQGLKRQSVTCGSPACATKRWRQTKRQDG